MFWRKTTKISITLGGQKFEASGDETFVRQAYVDFLRRSGARAKKQIAKKVPTSARVEGPKMVPFPFAPPSPKKQRPSAKRPEGYEDTLVGPPPRPPKKRRVKKFVRVHALNGHFSKVYPASGSNLKMGAIAQALDLSNLDSVYTDDPRLAERLRHRRHQTLWHAIIPDIAEDVH